MSTVAPAIITKSAITLTDRIKIQQQRIRDREYTRIGKLTCVVWEGQRSTAGASQSGELSGAFSKWQRKTWCAITLDWLTHLNAPVLAISKDRNDLLIPFKLPPLPDIPDPRWNGPKVAAPADCKDPKIPRIRQLLAGCPVVGDRACGTIKDRVSGKTFLIFQPLTELQVMCGGGKESGFGRIRCTTDPSDHTHSALLVNVEPDSAGCMEAYFVGGAFHAG
jgi:hypothetical protein